MDYIDGPVQVKQWIMDIAKEIESQNEEIIKVAERVGDKERMKIAERVDIDSDIADGLKNIVSNLNRLQRMIGVVNQRIERLSEKAGIPYV